MKNIVFLAHWSLAFVEEQFYALYKNLKPFVEKRGGKCIYFCEWHDRSAVENLYHKFFTAQNETKGEIDWAKYPPENNNLSRSREFNDCDPEETVFVVHFNPRHLQFFLQQNCNRFPRYYMWWQIEQATNDSFFENSLYQYTIENALALFEFSRTNKLEQFDVETCYTPFSRCDLGYNSGEKLDCRLENICNHQKRRLLQDNIDFTNELPLQKSDGVLLLGTCEPKRRKFFKLMCKRSNILLQHPNKHNYMFGREREQYIRSFQVAVNVHQYEKSCLEQAKLFLLLDNDVECVVSERSVAPIEEKFIKSFCGNRVMFFDSLEEIIAFLQQRPESTLKKTQLKNPNWFDSHFEHVVKQIYNIQIKH